MRRADHSNFLIVLVVAAGICAAQNSSQSPLSPDQQSTDQPSTDRPSTVRGTVVNSVTGTPIPRALVFSPGNHFAALTDGEGHFEFALPKGERNSGQGRFSFGPNVLLARKPGFLDGPTNHRPVQATPDSEITITLMPEAIIKGRIVSSETDPEARVGVQLFSRQVQDGRPRWLNGGTAQTNSNGEFRFAELQPGAYKLMTNESMDNDPVVAIPGGPQYGFAPVFYPGVAEYSAAGVVQIAAGQTVQADIPVARQPYYKVEIPVASADADNLNVTVSVQGHSGSNYSLGYNAEKHLIEGMLPNGKYVVEAVANQNSASGQVNLSVNGGAAQGPSLALIPISAIPVHVTEEFTATDSNNSVGYWNNGGRGFRFRGPRTYLQVNAESAEDFAGRGASLRPPSGANDNALFLENLSPGRYWLHLHTSRGYVAEATMGGVDLLREPLIVSPGSSAPIEITMRDDSAELDGTVTGIATPAPSGPSSQWVYCIPIADSPGQFQQVWVPPDGRFTSAAMAPGAYRVLAFANQQHNLPYRDAEAMKTYDAKGQVVHLSAGQKTSVQLQIISSNE